ncbi:C40 family peptidase [Domibacillus tundrae]|uniref:C40 family peptidase n=1 Tax=Domibacillus tundrae TaxID=1587527 RepID=UPI00155ADC8C|nr:NlpC/P60 family protein [Domibacillus tundrae]
MMELFLVQAGSMLEIPTEKIVWSGQRFQAARKIEATIFYDKSGYHNPPQVIEGNTVLFKWKGVEKFRGTVMDRSRSKSGMISIVAFDLLQYFLLNKELYGSSLNGKRLNEVALRICKDFEIPHAAFPNTSHKIKTLLVDTETALYDILLRGMIQTHKATKKRYAIYSRLGKVHINELKKADIQWILEFGQNMIDYNYTTSIQETATKVKMRAGDDAKPVTVTVVDDKGKKQFGVLQHYEKVSEKMNEAALKARANKVLAEKKGTKRTLDIESLGIADVTSGLAVYVKIADLRLTRTFFVDTDSHTFSGSSHTMSLKLIETNDYPEVEEPTAATASGSAGASGTTQATGKAAEVVKAAKSYIGDLTYKYGGKNIAGGSGDCSGFTKFIYQKSGINLGDGTANQVKKGRQIATSEAQAGDLVFFKGTIEERGPNAISHVGIVTRPNYCVSLGSSGCKEHGYTKATNSYWGKHFAHIRRVL